MPSSTLFAKHPFCRFAEYLFEDTTEDFYRTARPTSARCSPPAYFYPAPPRAPTARRMAREKDSAFTLILIQVVVMLDYGCVGAMRTVLPYYAKSLGAAATGVGALETIYGLGQIIGALLLGKLSDRSGRKIVLLLSFAGSAVGYGMAAFAVSTGSASLLLLSRLPVGLAKQTITASRSIISDVTSHADRTSVMARLFSSMALGYACGPVLGGILLDGSSMVELPAIMCALTFVLLQPQA